MSSKVGSSNQMLMAIHDESPAWCGRGINHEGESYQAELVIRPVFEGTGFLIWFSATGRKGEVFHQEVSILGVDESGRPSMSSLSTNLPFLQHLHAVGEDAEQRFEVIYGDPSDLGRFREKVTIERVPTGLRYSFDWAMPGEVVERKSSVLLEPDQSNRPECANVLGISRH